MALRRLQPVALALLGLVVLSGCHSRPTTYALDRGPMRDHRGQAASMVMQSDWVRTASADSPAYAAWYAGRNDLVPSVTAGYESARYEQTVTYTRDRQYISGGHVYDRYDQSTYRRTYREGAR